MDGYVKYEKNIQKQELVFGKVRLMAMMNILIKCYNKILINNMHTLHSMLCKGSIKAQIITGPQNSEIERVNCNRRVLAKFIKAVYFMRRKKWAVKNDFYNLMKHIRKLGDEDLVRHFQTMKNDTTYLSKCTFDELVKICSKFIEEKIFV